MDCMFSGDAATNEEHVLPRWMQKRFNLGDQTYNLPNGTTIQYKHAKVPVAQEHNSRFGSIEDRVARGVANPQELYLWAFKIHVGLIHRSSTLKVDIRSPSSPSFWDLKGFGQEIWLFQKLYAVWANNGDISPDPFGTVIHMKALTPQPCFDFIHNMQSGTLFFQLGDDVLFVVLYDQGLISRSNVRKSFEYSRQFIPTLPVEMQQDKAFVGQRVWACEAAYFHYRSRNGMSYISTDTSFHAIPPVSLPSTRPPEEAELAVFCRSFGLKLEHFGGEVNNVYSNLTADDILGLRQQAE